MTLEVLFELPQSTQPTEHAVNVLAWSAFDFYRKFTAEERIAIRDLAKTDPIAEDFYATLNAAIASGANVRNDDPDTVKELAHLESVGVLAPDRVGEILS